MKKRWIILGLVILFLIIAGFSGQEETKQPVKQSVETSTTPTLIEAVKTAPETPTPTETPITFPKHHIHSIEDNSYGNVKRYIINVIIEEPATPKQLEALSKAIVEAFKMERAFNALTIFYYDYDEYVGFGYTLGKVDYAPYGDYAMAGQVETGDYSKMEYRFDLLNKDWSLRLKPNEVKIWKAWQDECFSTSNPDEKEITKKIADKFDLKPWEVEQILIKQVEWTMNGED